MFLRSVNLLSFICKTCIYKFADCGVTKILYNSCSVQMTHHRKYRFNQSDTQKYYHRYQTEVRFSQNTETDTITREPYTHCDRYTFHERYIGLQPHLLLIEGEHKEMRKHCLLTSYLVCISYILPTYFHYLIH